MIKTYQRREEEFGFHLQIRQSQRVPPTIVTDLDFADEELTRLEQEAGKVGLHCNAKKTDIQP